MINIIDKQFIEISDYDQVVNMDGNLSENELDKIFDHDKIVKKIYT